MHQGTLQQPCLTGNAAVDVLTGWVYGCRDRIANHMFDDPPRVLPPEPEKARVALEMDDKKSHKVGSLLMLRWPLL